MTTGEITLSSSTYRMPRASTVSTSRTGRGAGTTWRHAPRTESTAATRAGREAAEGREAADGRELLFVVLLALAALALLGLLVAGPSLPWPATLGVGMVSVLVLGLAWAFTGPGVHRSRH